MFRYFIIINIILFFIFNNKEIHSENRDVITFLNGYQINGTILSADLNNLKIITSSGYIKTYPQNKMNFICFYNSKNKCKIYKPYERMFASLIPGIGQILGKQYREAKWLISLTYTSLLLSYLLYDYTNKELKKAESQIRKNNEQRDQIIEKLSGISTLEASKFYLNNPNVVIQLNEDTAKLKNSISQFEQQQKFLLIFALGIWFMNLGHAYQNGFTSIANQKKEVLSSEVTNTEKLNNKNKLTHELTNDVEGSFYIIPTLDNYKNNTLISNQNENISVKLNIGYKLTF